MKPKTFDREVGLLIALAPRHAMQRKMFDCEDGLHIALAPSSSDSISDDSILEPKHKIFLSHSGAQKEFVDHLCKALEEQCHYPFFDRRPESLPKGKKFPGLILEATQQCQLFVVVISEEYFMSKWPMIELNAFVKATKERKSNMNVDILPLFYGLSVSELKDEKRRQRWFEKWETFARDDLRGLIKVDDWKFALDELTKFNGLPYDRELKQVVEYENAIVSHICVLLPPDIKWEDSHVQGNAHEVVIGKMKQVGASQLAKVKVVGLYGVGGIGKTTVCKALCNELSSAFEGRVCHIEFDSTSSNSKELLQKVLIKLTRKSRELVQQLDEGECKDILYKNLMKHKTFLAIDNVWGNAYSIKQAKVFLQAPFHRDSLVLVTTRAELTLEHLGVDKDACLEMPNLGQEDARNLFLHHVTNGQQFTSEEDMQFIDMCIKRCYFSKGGGGHFHYHPLALEALGRHLVCRGKNPSEWAHMLSSSWNVSASLEENEVFAVLRSSFDLLPPIEQALFMDVSVFLHITNRKMNSKESLIVWFERLCIVFNQGGRRMQILLNNLKGKGLLQEVDLLLGTINMHDLYSEFAILEAKGKLVEATSIGNRRWAYVDVHDGGLSELEVTPVGGCWPNLTRLLICEGYEKHIVHPIESLEGIEWQYFSNVLILQLDGLSTVKGTLNLKGMKCLRSLQVRELLLIERLEGLEGLTNLTIFEWSCARFRVSKVEFVGQFPRSLKYLFIHDKCVLLGLDVLARCSNLCKLALARVEVGVQLDLSNCSSLENVQLSYMGRLLILVLFSTSKLRFLDISTCWNLIDIQGLEQLVCLKHLSMIAHVEDKTYLSRIIDRISLSYKTSSSTQHTLCHLQELHGRILGGLIHAQKLNGFNHLEVLNLSGSCNLTSMFGMGDWPALRSLNLSHCNHLQRLPNLSKSWNLNTLDLDSCDTLELHAEDIQMLATLPCLGLVHFSPSFEWGRTILDIRGWRLFQYVGTSYHRKYSQNWNEWEGKELGRPPIKLGGHGFRFSSPDVSLPETMELDLLQCI